MMLLYTWFTKARAVCADYAAYVLPAISTMIILGAIALQTLQSPQSSRRSTLYYENFNEGDLH
jgi:hypothetical protein